MFSDVVNRYERYPFHWAPNTSKLAKLAWKKNISQDTQLIKQGDLVVSVLSELKRFERLQN